MSWFSNLNESVQAALVGAAASLLVLAVRDVAVKFWELRVERRRTALAVYKQYADPLANSASSLMWRLHEIFHAPGRATFLVNQDPRTSFESYKRRSTLYRIASLLGWIRALRRELSFLSLADNRRLAPVDGAIFRLEASLADGPHVERERLNRLCAFWEWEQPQDEARAAGIAASLERIVKKRQHQAGVHVADQLEVRDQEELCLAVVSALGQELGTRSLSPEEIGAQRAAIIRRIAVREAWLYRDWQSGLGDLLILETKRGDRRFEVVGYRDFERLLLSSERPDGIWIERLSQMIDGIDLTTSDAERYDARIDQLRNTMVAVAALVLALNQASPRRQPVQSTAIEKARWILEDRDA